MSQPVGPATLIPPIRDFVAVREAAFAALRTGNRETNKRLRGRRTVVRIHYNLVSIGGYLLGIVSFAPSFSRRLIEAGLPTSPGWLPFVVGLIGWTLVLPPSSALVFRLAKQRIWPLLCYTILIVPVLLAIAEGFASSDWGRVPQQLIVLPTFSFVFLLLIFGLIYTAGGSVPEFLFLLLTSTRAGEGAGVVPSYEALTSQLIAAIDTTMGKYSIEQIEQVNAVAQQKHAGLGSRLGTLELVFGIFALIGLVQLALAQDQVAGRVNSLFQSLMNFINLAETTPSSVTGILVVGAILILLVIGGLWYAVRAYRELRLLEAIGLACTLRLNHEARHSAPAPRPAPTPLPQPGASDLYISSIFLGLLALMALVYRVVRRVLQGK